MKNIQNIYKPGLLLFILTLSACEKDKNETLCDPTPKFKMDLFIENLENVLKDNTQPFSGYQLAINQNGNLYYKTAVGFERHQKDNGGSRTMTVETHMNVASVSKFIGAIALMQVLEDNDINVDSAIYPYLPPRWQSAMDPGYKVKPSANDLSSETSFFLTFRKILTMQTGIPFPAAGNGNVNPGQMPTTDEMLEGLSQPGNESLIGTYQNGNFTLIRVLIGEIEYNLDEGSANYNLNTANSYFEYIKKNIFDKLSINNPLLSVSNINAHFSNNEHVMAYQFPFDDSFNDSNGNSGWAASNTPEDNGGSGGLMLNAIDLAKILANFMHDDNETLLSKESRDIILNGELGLLESLEGNYGTYQSKGGTRGADSNNRALRSRIVIFPNGVEAVLLTNCNYTGLGGLLRDSYDDAWVNECE